MRTTLSGSTQPAAPGGDSVVMVFVMATACARSPPRTSEHGRVRGLPPRGEGRAPGLGPGARDAVVVGVDDGRGPVPHGQLGEDGADVRLDGGLADVEGPGDLGVGG